MAVYTPVSEQQLKAFLQNYALGDLRAYTPIAEGVENTNYLLKTSQDKFILTLCEARVQRADLPFILGLMDHLAYRNFCAPKPQRDKHGIMLGELANRPTVIVSFLEGRAHYNPTLSDCAALGDVTAKFHNAAQDFTLTRQNALAPSGWQTLISKLDARANTIDANILQDIAAAYEICCNTWPKDLPRGPIHADLFPDNVFFDHNIVSGIIDYFFACTDFYAYELAICLNAWCFAHTDSTWQFDEDKAKALLTAYHPVRPLTSNELNALPLLCLGAALRFLLTRLVDYLNVPEGALVTPKDPREYLAKMRYFFAHQSAQGFGWML